MFIGWVIVYWVVLGWIAKGVLNFWFARVRVSTEFVPGNFDRRCGVRRSGGTGAEALGGVKSMVGTAEAVPGYESIFQRPRSRDESIFQDEWNFWRITAT